MEIFEPNFSSLKDIEDRPAVLTDFLRKNKGLIVVIEVDPASDKVRVGIRKKYGDDVTRILREVYQEHALKLQQGYSRDDAVKDFKEAQNEISKYLE